MKLTIFINGVETGYIYTMEDDYLGDYRTFRELGTFHVKNQPTKISAKLFSNILLFI
jgi:hypothetical protein